MQGDLLLSPFSFLAGESSSVGRIYVPAYAETLSFPSANSFFALPVPPLMSAV